MSPPFCVLELRANVQSGVQEIKMAGLESFTLDCSERRMRSEF
jgi:hypothetical protein